MQNLSGKTAVITGGASGIGLAMAHRFGAAGMRLVLGDVEAEALDGAVAELGQAGYEVIGHRFDVRDLDEVRGLEQAAIDAFGSVQVLCNNAGVGAGGRVADPDDIELWKWVIDIDLWGVIYGCKVFLPAMIASGEPGHVVNTASMAGHGSMPGMGAYNVSKYGVVALSETLTREMQLDQTQVGVSVLCPAFVRTGIADSERNLPDDLAIPSIFGDEDPGQGMQGMIRAAVAGGIDPALVADAVHDAIVADRFWILTHDHTKPAIKVRANEIVEGINPSLNLGLA